MSFMLSEPRITWAPPVIDTPAGGGFTSYCRIGLTSTQSVASGSVVKLNFDTVLYDNNSEWDTTDKRFIAKVEGCYHVSYQLRITSLGSGKTVQGLLLKNGNTYSSTNWSAMSTTGDLSRGVAGSDDVCLNVDEYIEIAVYHNHGSNRDFAVNSYVENFVAIHRVA